MGDQDSEDELRVTREGDLLPVCRRVVHARVDPRSTCSECPGAAVGGPALEGGPAGSTSAKVPSGGPLAQIRIHLGRVTAYFRCVLSRAIPTRGTTGL